MGSAMIQGAVGVARSRRRRRRKPNWRRIAGQWFAHLMVGLLLVGCQSPARSGGLFASWRKQPPPLEVLKTSKIADERIAAYRKLGRTPAAEKDHGLAVDLLAHGALHEVNDVARATAVTALGQYQDSKSVEVLTRALSDRSEIVRADACRALGKVGDGPSMALLARIAHGDPSMDVRVAATEAIAGRNDPALGSYLVACLRDKDVAVVASARKGLKRTFDVDLGPDVDAWQTYVKGHGGQTADPAGTDAAEHVADSRDGGAGQTTSR